MDNQIKEEFKNLIKELVDDQIKSYMKDNNIFRLLTGEIKFINNDRYSIDIGDTIISDVLNKSNTHLQKGDTVTVAEKIGSNFSNCFILCKNGSSNELIESVKNLKDDIVKLKKQTSYYISDVDEDGERFYIGYKSSDGSLINNRWTVTVSGIA